LKLEVWISQPKMGSFCARSKRSPYTGSDVVGGSKEDSVMAEREKRRELRIIARPVALTKSIAPTKLERLEF